MNKYLCTIIQIIYHIVFLSGASFYVSEFQKTRDTIVKQVDRIEDNIILVRETGESIDISIRGLRKDIDNIQKTCKRLKL